MSRKDNYGLSNRFMNLLGSSPALMRAYLTSKSGKAIMTRLSREGYDVDAFYRSADGQWLIRKMITEGYTPDDSPRTHRYWEERGLIKEVHGRIDRPESYWSIFIPKECRQQPENKLPLLFFMHGMNNPIRLMQGMGMLEIAAREKFIVVTPQNERPDYLEKLYNRLLRDYPADPARVYMMGYSYGSHTTAKMTLLHPEWFAAVGMGSMCTLGDQKEMRITGIDYPAFRHTEEMIERAAQMKVPCCMMYGMAEMLKFFPFYEQDLSYVLDAKENDDNICRFLVDENTGYDCFNAFRRMAGCGVVDPEAAQRLSKQSASRTEQVTGLLFENTKELEYNGRVYHLGESIDPDGNILFRFYAVEDALHMPTSMWSELTWEHMKRFRRNPETGKIEFTERK